MADRGRDRGSRRRSRGPSGGRKMSRHLDGVKSIDPHNYEWLRKCLSDHGKIMPSRLSGASAKQQRQIKRAVRRARVMGLLP